MRGLWLEESHRSNSKFVSLASKKALPRELRLNVLYAIAWAGKRPKVGLANQYEKGFI